IIRRPAVATRVLRVAYGVLRGPRLLVSLSACLLVVGRWSVVVGRSSYGGGGGMARIALPTSWAGALAREGGPLRIYQWLWLLLCTVGALVVATPRILSQPVVYSASATVQVQVDAAGRNELFNGGADDPDLLAVRAIALELVGLRQDALQQPIYQGLGSPTLNVRFEPQSDGRVVVVAVAP